MENTEWDSLSQLLYVHNSMILLTIHIISIGTVVGLTVYVFFSLGKKKGEKEYLIEKESKLRRKKNTKNRHFAKNAFLQL